MEAYQVLARKWRPKQFKDVVGQDHVVQTLTNAIKADRVAHAYLFVGPRGIGKTSIARIFAKALNCEAGMTPEPCDTCSSCTEIARGASLDVHELDAASNRGIDEIRALRDTIQYRPVGRFKIYIIDEVHMLTTEAFNALLKTLEEPPPHIKFFMATTDPQKIPATILSRCQRFDLRRIPAALLVERLRLIAGSEKVAVDDDALLAVARASEGGLRDAESALDQLIAFRGREIHEADVLAVFGLVSRQSLETIAGAMLKGDVGALVGQVEALDQQGKDMQRLLQELQQYVCNLLIVLQAGPDAVPDLVAAQVEVLREQAALTQADRLLRIADILVDTLDRLGYALSRKTLIETTLIRCARAAVTVSLDEIMDGLRRLKDELAGGCDGAPADQPAPAGRLPASDTPPQDGPPPPDEPSPQDEPPPDDAPPPDEPPAAPAPRTPADDLAMLSARWHDVLARVARAAPLARSCLVDAKPVAVSADSVTVGFDPEFAERLKQADQQRPRTALQRAAESLLGRPVSIKFVLGEPPAPAAAAAPPAPAAPAPAPSRLSGKKPTMQQKQKWFKDPAVQQTMDAFNGDILEIRD